MAGLFTAEQAKANRLQPTQNTDTELGMVLSKIEEDCYLRSGIYWGCQLSDETIAKLKDLHYTVLEIGTSDRPAYSIEWK